MNLFFPCGHGDYNSAVCPCACHTCDLSMYMNCPIAPVYCMLGLLVCCEVYQFGQLGTGLFMFSKILFQSRMSSFFKEPTASLKGDPELQA